MPPSSGTVKAVSSWIRQSFIDDFGEQSASRVAAVIHDNDISLRVLRSLSSQDIAELFPFFSFGQKRTFSLLLNEATSLSSPSGPPQTPTTPPPKRRKTFADSRYMSDTPISPPLQPQPNTLNEPDRPASPTLTAQPSITSPRKTHQTFAKSLANSANPVSQSPPTHLDSPPSRIASSHEPHQTPVKSSATPNPPLSPPPPLKPSQSSQDLLYVLLDLQVSANHQP